MRSETRSRLLKGIAQGRLWLGQLLKSPNGSMGTIASATCLHIALFLVLENFSIGLRPTQNLRCTSGKETGPETKTLLATSANAAKTRVFSRKGKICKLSLKEMVGGTGIEPVTPTMSR
jgi:hypothetical protein